ncbi:hypothetical protein MTES_1939 [Microbacterium testaceum StLB037]|uniref:Uncharacterized protein n=1 Tax=Microbacterium testaceum (strain StLB037) TaxID=979556 RepID=E8NCN4_MICTS|nr:hypothetical protein MTES_1939 [Microbacterium testaceum StLB037]
MASTPRTPRRGLPRVPGGEPWPPAVSGASEADDDISADGAAPGQDARGDAVAVPASQNRADLADSAGDSASSARISEPGPPSDPDAAGSTPASAVRRGLPRVRGGEPWPPATALADSEHGAGFGRGSETDPDPATPSESATAAASQNAAHLADSAGDSASSARISEPGPPSVPDAAGSSPASAVRRGLPRVRGGEPWPQATALTDSEHGAGFGRGGGIGPHSVALSESATAPGSQNAAHLADSAADSASSARISEPGPPSDPDAAGSTPAGTPGRTPAGPARAGHPLAGPTSAGSTPAGSPPAHPDPAGPSPAGSTPAGPTPAGADPAGPAPDGPTPAGPAPAPAARPPLAVPTTVWPGAAASAPRPARSEPKRIGPYTPLQWLGSAAVLGVFALALAGIAVLFARFVLAIEPGRDFLAAFPGEYALPEGAPVGLPVWLNWSHFLNSFFLLFIIRSGWQVRREKRPAAFWSPRKNKKRRISLALWFHQAIDILWIANGVIFVVLLFATGQWMRIVPTSWEVFPNAVSAALQYVSLDWPTENGWVNYNSLQQLSYFAITFIAAPLAILSGVRLSGVWPKDAEKLNRLYPVEWARKIHFPVMLFFVAFIVVHVALVLATGALRNLNHMYAARGAVDPGEYTSDPTGLLIFAASLLAMAAGWVAARPAVLVPIARLFGDVKQR